MHLRSLEDKGFGLVRPTELAVGFRPRADGRGIFRLSNENSMLMAYNASKYDDVVSSVKALCDRPFVEAIEDHYAVYWDELGLSVKLCDGALDAEILALRNDILRLLSETLPSGNPYFTWGVGFRRKNKTIEVLYPGDKIRDVTETLRPI